MKNNLNEIKQYVGLLIIDFFQQYIWKQECSIAINFVTKENFEDYW